MMLNAYLGSASLFLLSFAFPALTPPIPSKLLIQARQELPSDLRKVSDQAVVSKEEASARFSKTSPPSPSTLTTLLHALSLALPGEAARSRAFLTIYGPKSRRMTIITHTQATTVDQPGTMT